MGTFIVRVRAAGNNSAMTGFVEIVGTELSRSFASAHGLIALLEAIHEVEKQDTKDRGSI
jgi:hypothetical protein